MLKVVKVRLYPNNSQKNLLSQHFGASRFIYNSMLGKKIELYKSKEKLSSFDLMKLIPLMKKTEEYSWLKEIDSTSLQQTILNLDKAYQNFFRKIKKGEKKGFPQFKSKGNPYQSYQTSNGKIKDNKLYLPKIGLVRAVFHREIEGIVKTTTISMEAGKYFASILFEDGTEQEIHLGSSNNGKSIGIDMGVAVFAFTSDNKKIQLINLKKEIKAVKKAQKELSRKNSGSSNRKKAQKKLAKKHLNLKNKRDDFLHKTSTSLSNENQIIVVEDLKIKNMSKSATGTIENPNMRSSAKRGLNRSIMQQAWGTFFQFLEYKMERKGGKLIKVDPKYTSQTCSCCGHISKENRKSQSKFVCGNCQKEINADLNASINILKKGIDILDAAGTVVNTLQGY